MACPKRIIIYCTDGLHRDCYGHPSRNENGKETTRFCIDGDRVRLHWPDGTRQVGVIELDGENRVVSNSDIYTEEAFVSVVHRGTTVRVKLNETDVKVEKLR